MTEISERYKRLTDAFAAKVAAIPAEGWSAQTPCPDWMARDLVKHVIETQGMFLGLVGRQMGELPSVDDDLARVEKVSEGFGEGMRSPRAFGPALDVPAGADRQTKLLAWLGRQA